VSHVDESNQEEEYYAEDTSSVSKDFSNSSADLSVNRKNE
jgi:hypothetical protein